MSDSRPLAVFQLRAHRDARHYHTLVSLGKRWLAQKESKKKAKRKQKKAAAGTPLDQEYFFLSSTTSIK